MEQLGSARASAVTQVGAGTYRQARRWWLRDACGRVGREARSGVRTRRRALHSPPGALAPPPPWRRRSPTPARRRRLKMHARR